MPVAFNAETAAILARMSDNHRRRPTNRIERRKTRKLQDFPIKVVKAPSDGIAVGASGTCQAQEVSTAGALSNAGWTETVVNIWSTAIAADATLVIGLEDVSGRWIVLAEDCQ